MAAYHESIISAIKTALEGITVASGYSQDVQDVQRYDRRELSSSARPCIHILKPEERKQLVGDGWDVTLTVALDCYLYQDPASLLTTDELLSALQWDVETALFGVDWATLCADWVGEGVSSFAIEDPTGSPDDGLMFDLTITYRLAERDMTTPI